MSHSRCISEQPSSQNNLKKHDKKSDIHDEQLHSPTETEQVSNLENKISELEHSTGKRIDSLGKEIDSLKSKFSKFEREYNRLKINEVKATGGYKAYQIISSIMTIIAIIIAVYISFQILGQK